jgi:hypothetical protein
MDAETENFIISGVCFFMFGICFTWFMIFVLEETGLRCQPCCYGREITQTTTTTTLLNQYSAYFYCYPLDENKTAYGSSKTGTKQEVSDWWSTVDERNGNLCREFGGMEPHEVNQ